MKFTEFQYDISSVHKTLSSVVNSVANIERSLGIGGTA